MTRQAPHGYGGYVGMKMPAPFGEAPSYIQLQSVLTDHQNKSNQTNSHEALFNDFSYAVSSMVENYAPDFCGINGKSISIVAVRRLNLDKESEAEHIIDCLLEYGYIAPNKLSKLAVKLSKKHTRKDK